MCCTWPLSAAHFFWLYWSAILDLMRLNFQPLHSLCNAAESFVVASGAAHNFLPKISAFHATE